MHLQETLYLMDVQNVQSFQCDSAFILLLYSESNNDLFSIYYRTVYPISSNSGQQNSRIPVKTHFDSLSTWPTKWQKVVRRLSMSFVLAASLKISKQ